MSKKRVFGSILLVASITAGSLSFAMNVISGLSLSLMVGVAFGFSDIVKILLPVISTEIGWNKHLRFTYYFASVISIICAMLFMADQFGQQMLYRKDATASVAALDETIKLTRSSAERMRSEAFEEGERGGCKTKCKDLHARADQLDTELRKLLAKRSNVSVDRQDGKATILSTILGTEQKATSQIINVVLIVGMLVMCELVAHMAGFAARLLQRPQIAPQSVPVAPAKQSANRDYWLGRLQAEHPHLWKRVNGGELTVYAACVAAGLRKSRRSKWAKVEAYQETSPV